MCAAYYRKCKYFHQRLGMLLRTGSRGEWWLCQLWWSIVSRSNWKQVLFQWLEMAASSLEIMVLTCWGMCSTNCISQWIPPLVEMEVCGGGNCCSCCSHHDPHLKDVSIAGAMLMCPVRALKYRTHGNFKFINTKGILSQPSQVLWTKSLSGNRSNCELAGISKWTHFSELQCCYVIIRHTLMSPINSKKPRHIDKCTN